MAYEFIEIERDGVLTRIDMLPGDRVHVAPKTVHRMTAIEDCDIFEVSTPEIDDVGRTVTWTRWG